MKPFLKVLKLDGLKFRSIIKNNAEMKASTREG